MTPHSSLLTPHSIKALVVAPAWIGDTVMAQAAVHAAASKAHPRPANRCARAALGRTRPCSACRRYRADHRQSVHRTANSPSAARYSNWPARLATSRLPARLRPSELAQVVAQSRCLAGIPERIGFTGEARYGLINRRHTHRPEIALPQMAERFAQLAEARRRAFAASSRKTAALVIKGREQQAVDTRCAWHPACGKRSPSSALAPNTARPSAGRRRHFATLADRPQPGAVYAIWLLGSPKDKTVGDEIVALSSPDNGSCAERTCAAATSLTQAIDLIAASSSRRLQ